MVISGILLFYAIPLRTYLNIFFRIKAVLLILAGLNAFVFHHGIYSKLSEWDVGVTPPRPARVAGMCSLVLWAAIVCSGRMIAYNWFDCGKPQPAVIAIWPARTTREYPTMSSHGPPEPNLVIMTPPVPGAPLRR